MAGQQLTITYVGDAKSVLAAQKKIDSGHTLMQKGVAQTGGLMQQAFGIGLPTTLALGGAALLKFGADTVMAAANQGEAINKVNVIFGESAEEIVAWSETGAQAFGLSETAALNAAGGFGNMFQTMGLGTDVAADMSMSVVQLAGDMGSLFNLDPTEMLDKLRSGLAGEAEPLRQYGIFLSEAAVQQEAYQSGIAQTGEELTEAQKVQARYNLIMEQSTAAQGDFARTSESLPNLLRTASAEFANLQAEIGQALLPTVIEITRAAMDLMDALGPGLQQEMERIGVLAQIVGDALVFLSHGLTDSGDAAAGAKDNIQGFFTEIVEAMPGGDLIGKFFNFFIDGFDMYIAWAKRAEDQTKDTGASTEELIAALPVLEGNALAAAQGFAPGLLEALGLTEEAEAGVAEATKITNDMLRDQIDLTLSIIDASFGVISAYRSDAEASQELAAARRHLNNLEEQGITSGKKYREAVQRVADATLAAAEAHAGMVSAVNRLNQEIADGEITRKQARQEIAQMGIAAGLTWPEIRALQRELAGANQEAEDWEGRHHATFDADTQPALSDIAALRGELSALTADHYDVIIDAQTRGGSTAFDLIDHLRAELDSLEEKPWQVGINAAVTGNGNGHGPSRNGAGGVKVVLDRKKFARGLDAEYASRGW